jgi:2-polyprenyl-3-methyl-5-hydroxy-6-metoxy-1,4-benzoquinol methylase
MKDSINEYINREVFANMMLDKYYQEAPNDIVSDIGAGFGFMKAKIESLEKQWQPFDYYKKHEEITVWDLNETAPNLAKKAGMVVFLEVLEHLSNPGLALKNIADHMEQGAFIILTTPNPRSSKSVINLYKKGALYSFQEKHIKEHHVFTPWEHVVRFLLESTGFEVLEYGVVDLNYRKRKPGNFKDRFKIIIERYIERKHPKSKGLSYGIVARKK